MEGKNVRRLAVVLATPQLPACCNIHQFGPDDQRIPALRIVDMWLRPRTELLPSDPRCWEFNDDPKGSIMAVGAGLLNLAYVGAALLAVLRRFSSARYAGLLVGFVVLRSAFLGTIENPEPRYTLECYPVVIWLASLLERDKS